MTEVLTATELWFVEHGLPSFARRPLPRSTRKLTGLLVLVSLLEVALVAPSSTWSWWLDIAVTILAPALAATLVLFAVRAEARYHARSIGRLAGEAAFLGLPALAALLLASPSALVAVVVVNLLLLMFVELDQRLRFLSVVRWCLTHAAGQVVSATRRLSRSVPLLTPVVLALFYTSEAWQASASLRWSNLVAVMVILAGVGVFFAVVQARSGLAHEIDVRDRAELLAATPAAALPTPPPGSPTLRRAEEVNVNALLLVSQLCVVAVTAVLFASVIVLFGAIAISPGVLETWLGHPPTMLVNLDWGLEFHISYELAALGVLMTGVSGLVFAVSLAGDEAFQDLTRQRLAGALASAFAARDAYLAALDGV